jgi:hypothetical protein
MQLLDTHSDDFNKIVMLLETSAKEKIENYINEQFHLLVLVVLLPKDIAALVLKYVVIGDTLNKKNEENNPILSSAIAPKDDASSIKHSWNKSRLFSLPYQPKDSKEVEQLSSKKAEQVP